MKEHDVQFVVDANGERTGAIISLQDYDVLLEYQIDQDITWAAREGKGEPGRPFQDFVEELRAAGEIDV